MPSTATRVLRVEIRTSSAITLCSVSRGGGPLRAVNAANTQPPPEPLNEFCGRLLDRLAAKCREYQTRYEALTMGPDLPADLDAGLAAARDVAAIANELLPIVGTEWLDAVRLIEHIQLLTLAIEHRPQIEVPVLIEWREEDVT